MSFTSGKISLESGVCHCGSDIERHDPYSDNHSPVEQRPDNHNPILVEFRREAEALGRSYPKDWLRVCKPGFWPDGFDAHIEHIEHARRVLTKLAVLA